MLFQLQFVVSLSSTSQESRLSVLSIMLLPSKGHPLRLPITERQYYTVKQICLGRAQYCTATGVFMVVENISLVTGPHFLKLH